MDIIVIYTYTMMHAYYRPWYRILCESFNHRCSWYEQRFTLLSTWSQVSGLLISSGNKRSVRWIWTAVSNGWRILGEAHPCGIRTFDNSSRLVQWNMYKHSIIYKYKHTHLCFAYSYTEWTTVSLSHSSSSLLQPEPSDWHGSSKQYQGFSGGRCLIIS